MTRAAITLWLVALVGGCGVATPQQAPTTTPHEAGSDVITADISVDDRPRDTTTDATKEARDAAIEAELRDIPDALIPQADMPVVRATGDSSDVMQDGLADASGVEGNDASADTTKPSEACEDGPMDSAWMLDAGVLSESRLRRDAETELDLGTDVAENSEARTDVTRREAGRSPYPYDIDLIVNGRFALGDFYWQFNTAATGAADFSTTAGEATIAIRHPGDATWNIQLLQTGFRLTKGYAYSLSFDAWADQPTSFVAIVNQDREPYASYSGEQTIAVTPDRRRATVEFLMTEATDDDVRLSFDLGKSAGTIRLDDIRMTITSVEDAADVPVATMKNPGGQVRVTPCTPAADADPAVIDGITKAAHTLWSTNPSMSADVETANWARMFFATEPDFSAFLLNWANVESGGHFNARHENWSRNDTEQNLGVFQINQTWAVRHDTLGWHDSNPHEYASEYAFDTFRCADWALHHLIGFGPSAEWNLTRMLDGFWHGTLNDPSPYADGIYGGHIIDYSE